MTKVFGVLGATGQQGGSVIDWVLSNKELSNQYKIRAITRDPQSEKSIKLAAKIEVVQGDVGDQQSLAKALQGVHTLFIITNPTFTPNGLDIEFQSGRAIVDTAIKQGVQYHIFSSLPDVTKNSHGKWKHANHFVAKAKIEEYIRSLSIKSSFILPASFMANFTDLPLLTPKRADDGSYVLALHLSPQDRLPLIDVAADLGKFVGAILAKPDEYDGKDVIIAERSYTLKEVTEIMAEASGKNIVYKQIPVDEFKAGMPFGADTLESVLSGTAEFGYYGADNDKLVEQSASHIHGKMNSLEDFFRENPLKLE